MEISVRRRLIIPIITSLALIATSGIGIYKGISHHETWRIVLASIGGLLALLIIVVAIIAVKGAGKKVA